MRLVAMSSPLVQSKPITLSVPLASIATAEPEPELDDAAADPEAPASAEPDAEAEPDASADPDAAAEPDDAAELAAVAALADAAPPWPPDAPGEPFWFEEQPARTRIRNSATGGRRSRCADMESFLGRRRPHQVRLRVASGWNRSRWRRLAVEPLVRVFRPAVTNSSRQPLGGLQWCGSGVTPVLHVGIAPESPVLFPR